GSGRIPGVRKVAVSFRLRRHVGRPSGGGLRDLCELLGHEEEQPAPVLIPFSRDIDGTAQTVARDHIPVERSLDTLSIVEERVGIQVLAPVIPMARTM